MLASLAIGRTVVPSLRSLDTGKLEDYRAFRGAAFETLCKQSADTVFRLARRITRSNEDAEDVVQESFQLAFIHLKSFKGDSRASTWLPALPLMLP
jgi:DNA-directed RNA polymerase specialized sigma24 family protein